jgi:hypothetical protein
MQTSILVLLALLTYGNPILLLVGWFQRLGERQSAQPRWRTFLLWIGLAMATVAVAAFWIGTQYSPTSPENDVIFRRLLRASIGMAMIGLTFAVAGKGSGRILVAVSSLITPLSWFWALFMF